MQDIAGLTYGWAAPLIIGGGQVLFTFTFKENQMELEITAKRLIDLLNADNNAAFAPTPKQWADLERLVTCPSVQSLTDDELEIFVGGGEDEMLELARRSPALDELYSLLNIIFEGE